MLGESNEIGGFYMLSSKDNFNYLVRKLMENRIRFKVIVSEMKA